MCEANMCPPRAGKGGLKARGMRRMVLSCRCLLILAIFQLQGAPFSPQHRCAVLASMGSLSKLKSGVLMPAGGHQLCHVQGRHSYSRQPWSAIARGSGLGLRGTGFVCHLALLLPLVTGAGADPCNPPPSRLPPNHPHILSLFQRLGAALLPLQKPFCPLAR